MPLLEVVIKICGVIAHTFNFAENADKDDVRLVVDSKLDEINADNLPKGDVEIEYSDGTIHDDAANIDDADVDWD